MISFCNDRIVIIKHFVDYGTIGVIDEGVAGAEVVVGIMVEGKLDDTRLAVAATVPLPAATDDDDGADQVNSKVPRATWRANLTWPVYVRMTVLVISSIYNKSDM
jgi:hypothetical protein